MADSVLLIIDGNNLLMRCVKAMEYSGLRGGRDWSTGPLTAFIGALGRFTRDYEPDSLVVCWDHGPSRYRREIYPAYKSARHDRDPEAEERKETAFGMTKKFLRLIRVQQVAVPGFEADDLVAAYWRIACQSGDRVLIVSGDKDFLQLVGDRTVQIRPNNAGGYLSWGREEVRAEYGCWPEQLPLLMALVGDQVDGVPGVYGIGPKKALKGLTEADWDLDAVRALEDPEKRAAARVSRLLVDLRDPGERPAVPSPDPFRPLDPSHLGDCVDLVTFLRALEMETVLTRFYTNTLWS